jgi:hypothetical protein
LNLIQKAIKAVVVDYVSSISAALISSGLESEWPLFSKVFVFLYRVNSRIKTSDDIAGGGDHFSAAEKYEGRIVDIIGTLRTRTQPFACSWFHTFSFRVACLFPGLRVRKPSKVRVASPILSRVTVDDKDEEDGADCRLLTSACRERNCSSFSPL